MATASEDSFRGMVIDRLKSEFGEFMWVGGSFRWIVQAGSIHAPVHLNLSWWDKSAGATIWLFDPRRSSDDSAISIRIHAVDQIEWLIDQIKDEIGLNKEPRRDITTTAQ